MDIFDNDLFVCERGYGEWFFCVVLVVGSVGVCSDILYQNRICRFRDESGAEESTLVQTELKECEWLNCTGIKNQQIGGGAWEELPAIYQSDFSAEMENTLKPRGCVRRKCSGRDNPKIESATRGAWWCIKNDGS